MRFAVFPPVRDIGFASDKISKSTKDGIFEGYEAAVGQKSVKIGVKRVREAQAVEPVKHGEYNAVAPALDKFQGASAWNISIPSNALTGVNDLFLSIRYTGDIAHLSAGSHLLADNFYHGVAWSIGLKRFLPAGEAREFTLEILPLRKDAPIFLPDEALPKFGSRSDIAELGEIKVIPEYEIVVHAERSKKQKSE